MIIVIPEIILSADSISKILLFPVKSSQFYSFSIASHPIASSLFSISILILPFSTLYSLRFAISPFPMLKTRMQETNKVYFPFSSLRLFMRIRLVSERERQAKRYG